MTDTPMVIVVDDDHSIRTSLERLIRSRGWDVELFQTPSEFLDRSGSRLEGWCALLDYIMPQMSGVSLQQEMTRRGSDMPVVFMSGQADVPVCAAAMKQGAIDFLVKPVEAQTLFNVLDLAFEQYRDNVARKQEAAQTDESLSRLSVRERQVLEQIIRGQLNKQVAYDLGISEKTVKVHRARVMEKTGAKTLAELVKKCYQAGLLDQD